MSLCLFKLKTINNFHETSPFKLNSRKTSEENHKLVHNENTTMKNIVFKSNLIVTLIPAQKNVSTKAYGEKH